MLSQRSHPAEIKMHYFCRIINESGISLKSGIAVVKDFICTQLTMDVSWFY